MKKAHIDRIAEEMRKLEFDKVEIDPMGNVLGYMGTGKTLIGFDAHIDTVGIGNKGKLGLRSLRRLRIGYGNRRPRHIGPARRHRIGRLRCPHQ